MNGEGATGSVRVLPNRNTFGLVALLFAMWYAGASQSNGAAYLLCFVLAGMALVSILHAYRNLRGLRVSISPIAPVFVGERQSVRIGVLASPGLAHTAIRIKLSGADESIAFAEIRGPQWVHEEIALDAKRRGHFRELKLVVSSLYPLGFFSARMTVVLAQSRWIYPARNGSRNLPQSFAPARRRGTGIRAEGDDFAGLRAYIPGAPQRHIDWKAAARGRGLFVKQWAGEADESLIFRWSDTAGLAHEARLSQLACWIVNAERSAKSYGLEIPGGAIPIGDGNVHFHTCLRALADFPSA